MDQYWKNMTWLDPLLCGAATLAALFIYRGGVAEDYLAFQVETSVYGALLGGFISALGFLVAAQSIIFTLIPEDVARRLRKTRNGKNLQDLKNLFRFAGIALGAGVILSLIGQVLTAPDWAVSTVKWLLLFLVLFLVLKMVQVFWLVAQIGDLTLKGSGGQGNSGDSQSQGAAAGGGAEASA